MKTALTALALALSFLALSSAHANPIFRYVEEDGFGPNHQYFFDNGFDEVAYNTGTFGSYIGYDARDFFDSEQRLVPGALDALGLSEYESVLTNPDGTLREGVHVFVNEETGQFGFIVPPAASAVVLNTISGGANPQQPSFRTANTLRSGVSSRFSGGVNAGDPVIISPSNAIRFDYTYIDIGLDSGGGLSGSTDVYSVGYERSFGDLFIDFSYEFADDNWAIAGGGIADVETHTIAAGLSGVITNNIYGMLIGGAAFSDGGTSIGGVQVVGGGSDTYFITPGIGTSWAFGNLVIDAAISYLYQAADVRTGPASVNVNLHQFVADLGATVFITDTVYSRLGLSYNNIFDQNFGAGVPFDDDWIQISAELGTELAPDLDVYIGYSYEAEHSIYDTHSMHAGATYFF